MQLCWQRHKRHKDGKKNKCPHESFQNDLHILSSTSGDLLYDITKLPCPAKIPLENCIGRVISHADGAMKKSRIKQRPYSSNAYTRLSNKAAMNITKSHGKSYMPSRLVEKMHPEQFQVLGHNHEALGATLSMH